jgi:hypothetical protein
LELLDEKNKKPRAPKKFGPPKTTFNGSDAHLILEISLITMSESFDTVNESTNCKILEQGALKKIEHNTPGVCRITPSIKSFYRTGYHSEKRFYEQLQN